MQGSQAEMSEVTMGGMEVATKAHREADAARLCGAMTVARFEDDGTPLPRTTCRQWAGWGTSHPGVGQCKLHGGSTSSVKLHWARVMNERRAESSLGALLQELELDGAEVDRLEVLSQQVDRAFAMVTALGVLVGELPLRGGEVQVLPSGEPVLTEGIYGPDSKGDGKQHVLVTMYGEWVERAGRLAKLAKDCGLEERRVDVAESEGAELARIIGFVISGLELDTGKEELARTLLRQAIELGTTRATAIPVASEET